MSIELIKESLKENQYMSNEMKNDLLSLIAKLPMCGYESEKLWEQLSEKLKTLKVTINSPYVQEEAIMYSLGDNALTVNMKKLPEIENVAYYEMKALLNMATINDKDQNQDLRAFREGYIEMMASNMVGNGMELTPEYSILQIMGILFGMDTLSQTFFENDPNILYENCAQKGIDIEFVQHFFEKMNYDFLARGNSGQSNYGSNIAFLLTNYKGTLTEEDYQNLQLQVVDRGEYFDVSEINFGDLSNLSSMIKECIQVEEKRNVTLK